MRYRVVSYALNLVPLTKNARAIEALAPEYNPLTPLSRSSVRTTSTYPLLGWSTGLPCTTALTQSNGKLRNHENAPDNPPAIGTATLMLEDWNPKALFSLSVRRMPS